MSQVTVAVRARPLKAGERAAVAIAGSTCTAGDKPFTFDYCFDADAPQVRKERKKMRRRRKRKNVDEEEVRRRRRKNE